MKLILRSVVLLFLMMSAWASSSIADSLRSPLLNPSFQAAPTSPSDARLTLQGNLAVAGEVTTTLRLPPELSLSSGNLVGVSSVGEGGTVSTEWNLDASQDGYYSIELVISIEFDDPNDALKYGTTIAFNQYLEFSGGALTHSGEEPLGQYTARGLTDEQIFTHGDAQVFAVGEEALNEELAAGWIVVSVSGRVVYRRGEPCYSQDPLRGVPGVLVYLDWDGGTSPDEMSTPYYGGGTEGIDYAKTDMNGNFSFLFQFSSAIQAHQYGTSFITVYSTRSNAATKNYRYPDDNYFVEHDVIDISTAAYLVQDNGVQVIPPLNDGAALRSLYRSRQYAIDVLGYTPPFLRHYIWGSGGTAYFANGDGHAGVRHIDFDVAPFGDPAYHEYGHFIDDMWGGLVGDNWDADHWFELPTDWGTAWKEGWAEYFSAVVYEHYYATELTAVDLTAWDSVYQFLDRSSAQSRLDGLSHSLDRTKVEGAVASYLYSLDDSHNLRANGYAGDNDDIDLGPSTLLSACTNAEAQTLGTAGLVSKLNDLIKAPLNSASATSAQALFNFYVGDTGLPRSVTPTVLNVSGSPTGASLTWNDNTVPATITIPGQCNYSFDIYYQTLPTAYQVYRRPTEQSWDHTLNGYDPINTVSNAFAWTDPSGLDKPFSYVVVARNGAAESVPKAEARIVPPAYFDAPIIGADAHGVIDIVASVNTDVRGFTMSAPYDSFGVYWGSGSTPTTWHRHGIDYVISHTSTVSHATIGTWNTGVVQSGTYVLRLIAYYGSSSYETKHQVTVTHRATLVAAQGSIYNAMEWAEVGDTIRVSEGVHYLSLNPLQLKMSVQLMAASGVVEIRPSGVVIMFEAIDLKYRPTITGITFKRTEAAFAPASYAFYVDASSIKFKNCEFDGMQAWYGGAINAIGPSNISLQECEFMNTQQYQSYIGSVISMSANAEGKPTGAFDSCTFHGNAVPTFAISYLANNPLQDSEPKPSFERCHFEGNSSSEYVVKIANSLRTINFLTCTFVDNTLRAFDATPSAMVFCDNAKVLLDNCTIANNAGQGIDAGAVSIGSSGTSPVRIDDSIIAFNGGPVVNKTDAQMPSDVTLTQCILFGNTAGSYRTDGQWQSAGTDVFAEDPAFCNAPNGEYTLYAFSPAVAGPHFTRRVGAYDIACAPSATVSVNVDNGIGKDANVIVGCPAGDQDSLLIEVDFDDAVMTRTVQARELSIQPPYAPMSIYSDTPILGDTPASAPSYKMTLGHKYISGYGTDLMTLYLNGYPLTPQAQVHRRGFDIKSAGPTPPPCGGDVACPDGKVSNADLGAFLTHYPTPGNPGATYWEACDFASPFGAPVGLSDLSTLAVHIAGSGHTQPFGNPLFVVTSEATASTRVALAFTDEFVTATTHRLYADLTLEDCAGVNWCLFAMRPNRSDVTLVSWEPSEWAAGSAPFFRLDRGDGEDLAFAVIMINDTEASSRHLGRLVFNVAGDGAVNISDDQFVLTLGELEYKEDSFEGAGQAMFAHMSGVFGRTLAPAVQQVFHNRLEQNFPNPFNPQTTLAYSLKQASDISLIIYDVGGRRVRELVNEHRVPGAYRAVWDGRDGKGAQVASGVYFYKLVAGSFVETKKMIMLK